MHRCYGEPVKRLKILAALRISQSHMTWTDGLKTLKDRLLGCVTRWWILGTISYPPPNCSPPPARIFKKCHGDHIPSLLLLFSVKVNSKFLARLMRTGLWLPGPPSPLCHPGSCHGPCQPLYLCGQSHPISECLNVLSPCPDSLLLAPHQTTVYLSFRLSPEMYPLPNHQCFPGSCALSLVALLTLEHACFVWFSMRPRSLLLLGDLHEDDGKGQGRLIPCCIPGICPRPDSCSVNEGWLVNGWMNGCRRRDSTGSMQLTLQSISSY